MKVATLYNELDPNAAEWTRSLIAAMIRELREHAGFGGSAARASDPQTLEVSARPMYPPGVS